MEAAEAAASTFVEVGGSYRKSQTYISKAKAEEAARKVAEEFENEKKAIAAAEAKRVEEAIASEERGEGLPENCKKDSENTISCSDPFLRYKKLSGNLEEDLVWIKQQPWWNNKKKAVAMALGDSNIKKAYIYYPHIYANGTRNNYAIMYSLKPGQVWGGNTEKSEGGFLAHNDTTMDVAYMLSESEKAAEVAAAAERAKERAAEVAAAAADEVESAKRREAGELQVGGGWFNNCLKHGSPSATVNGSKWAVNQDSTNTPCSQPSFCGTKPVDETDSECNYTFRGNEHTQRRCKGRYIDVYPDYDWVEMNKLNKIKKKRCVWKGFKS